MTLLEKRDALLARLSSIHDTQERFAFVVECGRRHALLDPAFKTDTFRVEGCLAQLWLRASHVDGKCYFETDSDSAIMKGVAVVLCEFYSGQSPDEIIAIDPSFLRQVGLTQHLSPNRRNGLARIWQTIRDFAAAHANTANTRSDPT